MFLTSLKYSFQIYIKIFGITDPAGFYISFLFFEIIWNSRIYAKSHRIVSSFDFWFSVTSTERTSHISLQTLFEADSVVEPIGVQGGGSSQLLDAHLHSIGNERLLGAVKKNDVLRESHVKIVFNEILEADAALGGPQLVVEARKLVHHKLWKTFNKVLNHHRLLFLDSCFVEAKILVTGVVIRPHLVLNVLSQIHDVL